MNRKLSLVLALVLAMSILLTACGPNALAYMEKNAEVEKWEATEGKVNVKVAMNMSDPESGEKFEFEIPMEIELYMIGKDKGKVDVNYDFSALKAIAPTEAEDEMFPDELKASMYIDGEKMIMPKELFTMGMPGATLPKILEGDEQFIAFDLSEFGFNVEEKEDLENEVEKIGELIKKIYEGYKSDFDMKREGDKFSYEMNIEEGAKELKSFVKYTKENSDAIFNAIEAFVANMDKENVEMNKAMLEQAKGAIAELKEEDVDKLVADMTKSLEGSKISEVTEFKEDSVDQKVNFVLNVKDAFNINMEMKAEIKKAEVKEIEIPKDVKVIKYSEYMESMMAEAMEQGEKQVVVYYNGEPLEFDSPAIIEDGRTLVPFRAFLEKLGATVEWNEEDKIVTAKHDDKEIVLTIGSKVAVVDGVEVELDKEAKIVEDRTLVPLRFISENFGFNVEFEEIPFAFFVSVMSPDYVQELPVEEGK